MTPEGILNTPEELKEQSLFISIHQPGFRGASLMRSAEIGKPTHLQAEWLSGPFLSR